MEYARPHSPRQRARSETGKVDWSAHSRGVRQDVKGAPPKEEKAKQPESIPTGKANSADVPDLSLSRTSLMTPTSSTRGAKRPSSPRAKFSPGNVQALSIDLIQSSISKTTNLQQQLETLESALKQKTKEHSDVLTEVATLKKLLRDKDKGLAQTTSELEKQREKSLQLEVEISQRTSALREAEVTIRSKNEETRRLNTTSTMSERNQEALLETLQKRRNMDNLEQDLYTARQDADRLMEELRSKDKELKYRAETLKNLESQLSQERSRGIEAARKEGGCLLLAPTPVNHAVALKVQDSKTA
ncbi:hypothetical protein CYMTET_30864 [Cymbomonas tetramitiformis]|uniref:Uncharacterized protein n=1 Tax=Cymbomonas tetramitiformis TaxID=36881 RepID=A0AAE0KTH1_9CHLO|nr:hypothetical protein CYMTET_30864 [Cymbomonas tetramitiformis]